MDPTQKFNPTFSPESSQMLTEENSRDDSGASQNFSETLIKNLSKLTLNAGTEFPSPLPEGLLHRESIGAAVLREVGDDLPYRRGGVRTLLSVQRERMARFRYMLLGRGPRKHVRTLTNTGLKGVKNASRMFKCPCSFFVSSGWSENARIGNYDSKPLQ
ncbi:developmental pluripotency-associated protein 3 [Sapajus apella]|uniref:Developmental pluripotency-associated protein 3 n=1 Tax=Sapajus apella TaxID=9515 RepID=A0A6J3I2W6_SAPAP|nr:developmental pluripotency-associated protein 3 [Sapajus apella]